MRLIAEIPGARVSAKVYRDAEWGEYRVRFYALGTHLRDADYHTDDREDAMSTARCTVD